jgi:hypothetical protein
MMICAVTEVCDLVATDYQLTIKTEHQLHIHQETIQQMLHEDSGQRKLCTKSVPHTHTHSLTYMKEEHRVLTGKDFITAQRSDTRLIHWVTTADLLLFPK